MPGVVSLAARPLKAAFTLRAASSRLCAAIARQSCALGFAFSRGKRDLLGQTLLSRCRIAL
jgi:hypothetical protein